MTFYDQAMGLLIDAYEDLDIKITSMSLRQEDFDCLRAALASVSCDRPAWDEKPGKMMRIMGPHGPVEVHLDPR